MFQGGMDDPRWNVCSGIRGMIQGGKEALGWVIQVGWKLQMGWMMGALE